MIRTAQNTFTLEDGKIVARDRNKNIVNTGEALRGVREFFIVKKGGKEKIIADFRDAEARIEYEFAKIQKRREKLREASKKYYNKNKENILEKRVEARKKVLIRDANEQLLGAYEKRIEKKDQEHIKGKDFPYLEGEEWAKHNKEMVEMYNYSFILRTSAIRHFKKSDIFELYAEDNNIDPKEVLKEGRDQCPVCGRYFYVYFSGEHRLGPYHTWYTKTHKYPMLNIETTKKGTRNIKYLSEKDEDEEMFKEHIRKYDL